MAEFYSKANEAYVDEQFEEALQYYSQAIEAEDNNAEFYLRRSQTQAKLENFEAAEKDARKSVELNPGNHKGHLRLGEALFKMSNYEEALKEFQETDNIKPNDNNVKTWLKKCEPLVPKPTIEEEPISEKESGLTITELPSEPAVEEPMERGLTITELPSEPAVEEPMESGLTITELPSEPAGEGPMESGLTITELPSEPAGEGPMESGLTITELPSEPAVKEIPMPPIEKQRYDWYQTETHVVINILIKRASKDDVDINYAERSVSATVKQPSGTDYSLELDLSHEVVPSKCITKVLGSKIELKMKKAEGIRWSQLQGDGEGAKKQKNIVQKYPTSSHYTRNWDKLVKDFEKDNEPTGEAAVNHLFQKIYADGSDEVRRAMNKSYSESGGTVLSTNWDDIGKKKTEIKAPDGMEYRKWNP